MTSYPQAHEIRIGTLVDCKKRNGPEIIRQILPYGFESFSLTFWQTLGGVDLRVLAQQVSEVICDKDVKISALSVFGNPLETTPIDMETLAGWESAIDNAHLFGCNLVTGFTGRLRGKSIPDSMARFKEVWTPLVQRAADRGVCIAFENCDMEGNWRTGDWNIAHNPLAWEMMFDAIPAANLGLEWEPCHQMVNLIDPLPQLRQWLPKVLHVHGKCATVKWDIVRQYGIGGGRQFAWHRTPGFGNLDWTHVIDELRWGGYHGAIDIEGYHDPVYRGELEMTGQVAGLNYLKRCRGGEYVPNPV
jgi:sugar phosphate isomerase/epimerase